MSLIVHFRHFDPLTGKLPESYDWMFTEIAYRARKLLTNRSSDEINAAAKFLTAIHRQPGYVNPHWEELKQEGIPTVINGQVVELIAASNEVETIYKNVSNVSIADCEGFINAEWHELFAIVSLSYLENICAAVHAQQTWEPYWESKWLPGHKSPNPFPQLTDSDIKLKANDWLVLAHQAISFADALKNQEAYISQSRSAEKSRAAKKKYKETSEPLKQAVLKLYQEKYTHRSNRHAAFGILHELEKTGQVDFNRQTKVVMFNGKNALLTDDPEHRFEVWIGNYKKTIQA